MIKDNIILEIQGAGNTLAALSEDNATMNLSEAFFTFLAAAWIISRKN